MSQELTFVLHGISKQEKTQLESEKDLSFKEEPIPAGSFGEPVTFAVIATIAGISALAAFLLKKNHRKSFEQKIEIVKPDGTKEIKTIKFKESSSEPTAEIPGIVKQIQSFSIPTNVK